MRSYSANCGLVNQTAIFSRYIWGTQLSWRSQWSTIHNKYVCIFSVTLPALPWHSHCHTHPHVPTAPGPPQDLTLVNRTCHSITFQWSPPDDTGRLDVTGYDILHNGTPVANITGTVYTLEGLTPDTVHTISVRTRNAIGTSEQEGEMTNSTTQQDSGGWK